MRWLLIFILIAAYLLATHQEIIIYVKMLWEKIKRKDD